MLFLSQLLRGFTKGIRDLEELDAVALARAVDKGVETAYKAVMKPKEGTILTVARGVADKALELAEDAEDLQTFLEDVLEEGRRVLCENSGYAAGTERSRCCGFRRTGSDGCPGRCL